MISTGSTARSSRSCARYLIAYHPASAKPDDAFRIVRLEVDRKGTRVLTRRGYYPRSRATPPRDRVNKPAAPEAAA